MSELALIWAEAQAPGSGCCPHLLEQLAKLFDDDLGFAYPSNRYLAGKLRKSEATIDRNLAALEAAGFIERTTKRWGPDGGARREIRLKGFDPVEAERQRQERRARKRSGPARKGGAEAKIRSPHSEGQVTAVCGSGLRILRGHESREEFQEDSGFPQPPETGGLDRLEKEDRVFEGAEPAASAEPAPGRAVPRRVVSPGVV